MHRNLAQQQLGLPQVPAVFRVSMRSAPRWCIPKWCQRAVCVVKYDVEPTHDSETHTAPPERMQFG